MAIARLGLQLWRSGGRALGGRQGNPCWKITPTQLWTRRNSRAIRRRLYGPNLCRKCIWVCTHKKKNCKKSWIPRGPRWNKIVYKFYMYRYIILCILALHACVWVQPAIQTIELTCTHDVPSLYIHPCFFFLLPIGLFLILELMKNLLLKSILMGIYLLILFISS